MKRVFLLYSAKSLPAKHSPSEFVINLRSPTSILKILVPSTGKSGVRNVTDRKNSPSLSKIRGSQNGYNLNIS